MEEYVVILPAEVFNPFNLTQIKNNRLETFAA
jgi:hypothetical protein